MLFLAVKPIEMKIRLRVFLLPILCMCVLISTAQEEARKTISVQIGPSFLYRQDLTFSPFVHQDISFPHLQLQYTKEKKWHQVYRLGYSGFNPGLVTPFEYIVDNDTTTAFPHSYTFVNAGYQLGRPLGKRKQKNILGGMLNMDVQALNNNYGRFSTFGYFSSIDLGAWYKRILVSSEKHVLSAGIELALVSWQARSPYLVNDDEYIENTFSHNGFTTFFAYLGDGNLTSIHKLRKINVDAEYEYHLGSKWITGINYSLHTIFSATPRQLASFQHSLFLKAGIKF